MTDLTYRLDDFGRRLEVLERELAELRQLAHPEPAIPAPPVVPPPPRVAVERPAAAPRPRPPAPPPRRPAAARRELDLSVLFGAKALAWAGGAVMLLGIVFFFVLAVNRGWIGPVARVSLGAIASALVFGAGLYVKRRSAELYHSALAAVGVGIGGAYMTLLAATVLYDLAPDWAALLIAAGIASVGVATAIAWSSELIAGLGLIGALLAPAAVGLQAGELTAAGTGFAAVVFAGTVLVAIRQRWSRLLVTGIVASVPQVAILVAQAEPTEWDVVSAATLFWALYLGAAVAWQDRLGTPKLSKLTAPLLMMSGVLAGAVSAAQFEGRAEGWATLLAAGTYGALAAMLFPAKRHRDLSALLGAIGLALAAVGLAELLSGPTLAIAWAAEAAVLAWLAQRIDEKRYQLASIAYLVAALVHGLLLDAPPTQFFQASVRPAQGAVAFVGAALAGAVVAWYVRKDWRQPIAWTSSLAGLYAASLGVLGVAEWVSSAPVDVAFDWGHVGVVGLWGVTALAVLTAGHLLSRRELRIGGLVWLAATLVHAYYYVSREVEGDPRGWAYLVAGVALLAGALIDRLWQRDDLSLLSSAAGAVASIGLGVAGLEQLVEGARAENLSLLALAAFYAVLAAAVFTRERDLSTFLWAPGLVVAGAASWLLLDGTWLVLAWSAASVGLILLARWTGEKRLELASGSFLLLALAQTLVHEAPLGDLFQSNLHPESGVPALLLSLSTAAMFAIFIGEKTGEAPSDPGPYAEISHALDAQRSFWRRLAGAAVAVLITYAISLTILGVAEAIGNGGVTTDFQRGHSAVSAFWGLIGLAVLYLGLKRGLNWLRLVGFGLFGLALAKLFLYDLAFLSSITRALSFLAVGAVLLVAGFFVQRLSEQGEHAQPS
jgi:uncharacterized membrane protein